MPADEVFALATDFGKASPRVATAIFTAYKEGGELFAEAWKANAEATSGVHGKHYPNSITSEVKLAGLGINIETGPDSAMKQGVMGRGFELGSKNQPPHLDGLRALGPADAKIQRLSESAIGEVLP